MWFCRFFVFASLSEAVDLQKIVEAKGMSITQYGLFKYSSIVIYILYG